MKNVITVSVFLLIILGCNKEERLLEAISESQIVSINVERTEGERIWNWEEEFIYNELDQLVSVNNFSNFNRIEFTYNSEGQLLEYLTFENSGFGLSQRDSFVRDGTGKIDLFYTFRIDNEGKNSLSSTTDFIYDASGKIMDRIHEGVDPSDWGSKTRYTWEGENIVKEERLYNNLDNSIRSFEYDRKANYKRNNPLYIKDPFNSTLNNVTDFDHTGVVLNDISRACVPCKYKYNYTSKGLPKKVVVDRGVKIELEYMQ